jgi:Holliday junction resolvase RusA-like endonuclease
MESLLSKKKLLFSVPGKPQGKQRAKVSTYGGFARAYTPEETVAYENLIKLSFKQALKGEKTPFWETPVSLTVVANYAIPKSFSKKKRGAALGGEIKPQTKPDIDNVVKVVCDALNSVAYRDDTQVIRVIGEKVYSDEPKLEVLIREL